MVTFQTSSSKRQWRAKLATVCKMRSCSFTPSICSQLGQAQCPILTAFCTSNNLPYSSATKHFPTHHIRPSTHNSHLTQRHNSFTNFTHHYYTLHKFKTKKFNTKFYAILIILPGPKIGQQITYKINLKTR